MKLFRNTITTGLFLFSAMATAQVTEPVEPTLGQATSESLQNYELDALAIIEEFEGAPRPDRMTGQVEALMADGSRLQQDILGQFPDCRNYLTAVQLVTDGWRAMSAEEIRAGFIAGEALPEIHATDDAGWCETARYLTVLPALALRLLAQEPEPDAVSALSELRSAGRAAARLSRR